MRLPASRDLGGEDGPQTFVSADAPVKLAHQVPDERAVDVRMNDGSFLGRALQLRRC
jgi:hypothetical protein